MADHNETGKRGEDIAVNYLIQKGYHILSRNWSNRGRKELDIVAMKDDTIVFVEVKTRRVGSLTTPFSAVNARKQHNICLAADSYIRTYHINKNCRIDVIGITYGGDTAKIEHIEDAIRPRLFYYR